MRFRKVLCFALLAATLLFVPAPSEAQIAVGVAIRIGPPVLPVYPQPICPGAGYIWTPGYWAYGPDGYFWVPGTWVLAPTVGVLWTPGYWGFAEGIYVWHAGYWGPHVGFYGGINYGYGYGGVGFVGGEWRGGVFAYNRSVTNVNVTEIHNTYNTTIVNKTTVVNNVSYNGGTGGTTTQPNAREQAAARENHMQPTTEQTQHEHVASTNRAQLASVNHGQPAVAASAKAGVFNGKGVVAARPAVASNANRAAANSASRNRPGNSGSPNASNTANRNDRPPSAMSKTAATSKPNHAPSSTANSSRPPQNGHAPVQNTANSKGTNGNRPPSAQQHPSGAHPGGNAPHPNNRPAEHGRERP